MTTNLKPLGYRVLIKPGELKTKSEGELIIVNIDEARARAQVHTGTVVDIGPTAWNALDSEKWANIGDRVLFSKYGGKTIYDPITDDRYEIINDEDVLCLIRESK